MVTVRQIQKLWEAKFYARLCNELLAIRPEYSPRLSSQLNLQAASAAMAIIRLDELSQWHVPLYGRLVQKMVSIQEGDGGWADPLTTSLCLRALLCGRGGGVAIGRGLSYLANLQKSEGLWPAVPIRRLPADAYVSAFILFQLAEQKPFRDAIRLQDAAEWFESHDTSLDDDTRILWDLTHRRISARLTAAVPQPDALLLWS